ncbi:hypothetical protein AKJ09_05405 [Labilithrix luteola]|uniref:Uncharacterized protein n=1 Tax=Labilithrix luteola TaxID=1391654 RepID=A0A0K1PZE0_9BACT|nr:hypothetical protein AKJ09_05405 [Labilithrix luteola]
MCDDLRSLERELAQERELSLVVSRIEDSRFKDRAMTAAHTRLGTPFVRRRRRPSSRNSCPGLH